MFQPARASSLNLGGLPFLAIFPQGVMRRDPLLRYSTGEILKLSLTFWELIYSGITRRVLIFYRLDRLYMPLETFFPSKLSFTRKCAAQEGPFSSVAHYCFATRPILSSCPISIIFIMCCVSLSGKRKRSLCSCSPVPCSRLIDNLPSFLADGT